MLNRIGKPTHTKHNRLVKMMWLRAVEFGLRGVGMILLTGKVLYDTAKLVAEPHGQVVVGLAILSLFSGILLLHVYGLTSKAQNPI